jgi:demethylmenaquinone methyltransferase/2-methoxy-6-polyprenyl-1,4-benzoquinol methylase
MDKGENRKSSIPPYTWLLSRRPNFMASFTHSLRKVAVEHLELQKGDRVLDVGCGTGASFPYLVQAVGTSGEVVGVEISPDMAVQARKRVESHRWGNVCVLEDAAQTVQLAGQFDGLLLFAAHEVFTSLDALDHLLVSLQKDAHVVAFGAKRSSRHLGILFNPLLSFITHHLLPSSTSPIDDQPWRLLEERLGELHKQERVYGFMYLVCGSFHTTDG